MKILFATIILGLATQFSFGHPGRTDANGGHYNSKTGEYHYHSGPKKHAPEKPVNVAVTKDLSKTHSKKYPKL